MTAAVRPSWKLGVVVALMVAATLVVVIGWNGDLLVAAGPVLVAVMFWVIWRSPVRSTLLWMMLIGLSVDSPQERPAAGLWESPLHLLGKLYFTNLHSTLEIPPLRFSGLELLLVYLVGVVTYRRITGSTIDGPSTPAATPLRRYLLLSFVALAWLELYGLLRGGDLKESIWQFRVLLSLPAAAFLFTYALRGSSDLRPLGRVVVLSALVKVGFGAYFYYVLCKPNGVLPPYVTTHTDTVLYAVAVMICIARWWEEPTGRNTVAAMVLLPLIFWGVVLNDRRLAYVTIAAALVALFAISARNAAKRFALRLMMLSLPLWIPYAVVGWGSSASVFKPVRIFRSVISSDTGTVADSSTNFRDMENFNLVFTGWGGPLLGTGFGHEYQEIVHLPDISRFMPNYRYLPHNSVLWLWSIGGAFGFSAIFLYLAVNLFLAVRTYRFARTPLERSAMLVSVSCAVAYLNQCFGDMGSQSYTPVFLVAASVGVVSQLAVSTGAWRERRPQPVQQEESFAGYPALHAEQGAR